MFKMDVLHDKSYGRSVVQNRILNSKLQRVIQRTEQKHKNPLKRTLVMLYKSRMCHYRNNELG